MLNLKRLALLSAIGFFSLTETELVAANFNNTSSSNNVYINTLSIQNANIKEVAQLLAKLTNKNLLISPDVRGKISLDIKTPLTGKQLWNIFSIAIAQMGYTLRYYPKTNLVEVLPVVKAKKLIFKSNKGYFGEFSVAIFQLKNINVNSIANRIRNFISPYGKLEVLDNFNIIIVYDFTKNINFIKNLLEKLDKKEYSQSVEIFKTKKIPINKLQAALRPIIDWYRNQRHLKIYTSVLTNENILIISAPKKVLNEIKNFIIKLDNSTSNIHYNFYVLKLKYSSIDEVKNSINSLLSKLSYQGKNLIFSPVFKISYDKINNSILVFGTKKDFEIFKKLVEDIDKRRKQVLIVATIIEASTKKILDEGIRWQILGSSGGLAFGATSKEGLYEALGKGQFVIGTLSNSGVSVNIGGNKLFFPDLLFLYTLLEQGTGFNIISNPKILTLDNQKAVIKVGQDVPYPTGIKYDVNGNPIITYNYKYVGLQLDVLPQISEQNLRLVINLKVQEITGYLTNNVGGINYSVPITSTRELNSDVIVQNGQTVIIGGLISQKKLQSITKVPFMGDIPIIGGLFKNRHNENDKTNLFIFITPYVISSPKQLSQIMEEHKKLALKLFKEMQQHFKIKQSKNSSENYIKVDTNESEKVVLPY